MQGSSSSGTKRSSKWDQMTVEAVKPSVAAAEVAAKLNAKLAAEGKLIQSTPPQLPPTSATSSSVLASVSGASKGQQQACGFFTAEVDINNSLARSELIKTTTLTEINRATGAFVSVRGKYMSMEEQKDGDQTERLQYLHIQSTTQERVNNAVDRIKAIIAGETTNKQFSNQQQQYYVQDKVFIGMDHAPESFKLLDRLSGPGGSYLAHIAEQTGAKVYLRGKGSGFLEPTSGREAFEALYLYISHPAHSGMIQAKKLCESLVSTVRKELQQFTAPMGYGTMLLAQPPPPPVAAGAGGAYTYMQQPPFYASYQMGSHDPRMLPPQQYGGQPFPLANPPPQGAGMTAPPFPPYFGAVPPYTGAPPPQPFVASSVPPNPYAVPPQTGPIPPLLPPAAVTTIQSDTTTSATEEYSVSSADGNKTSSSNIVYSLAHGPTTTSTGKSPPSPAPSKLAKRRFTEKPNMQAEVLKSSLSVNAYTDVNCEVTRSIDDTPGNRHQDRVTNQESKVDEVDAEVKKDETKEYKLIDTDDKSELHFKNDKWKPQDDKWKPVIDDSEKDKILMPPPGGFSRLPAGQRLLSKQKEFIKPKEKELLLRRTDEEDELLKGDEDDSTPAKKLKLVVYGDSDSDND